MPYRLEDIQELISDSANESQVLEFKQQLPRKDHDARAEFAKDICAMANAGGGSILYGVAEAKGCASMLQPIMDESFDHARRRLQQTLSSAVEPAGLPITFHEIRCDKGYVLEIDVEQSTMGPHRVIENGRSHFFVRTPTQVTEMRYDELREAFTARERAEQRFHIWRQERVDLARSAKRKYPLIDGPKAMLHIAPLEAFQKRRLLDMREVYKDYGTYVFGRPASLSADYNLDGVLIRTPLGREPDYRHIQVFRTGMLESIWMIGRLGDNTKTLPAQDVAMTVRHALHLHLRKIKDAGFQGPSVIAMTLFHMDGCALALGFGDVRQTDRDVLSLPEIVVPDIGIAITDIDAVARPLLDLLWQCFDVEHCNYYSQDTGEFLIKSV